MIQIFKNKLKDALKIIDKNAQIIKKQILLILKKYYLFINDKN